MAIVDSMSIRLLSMLILLPLGYSILRAILDPLRSIPGPFLARFTRLWYLVAVRKGNFQDRNVELHRKYGPVVRVAPEKYSFQDADATAIIYNAHNVFPKSRSYSAFAPPDDQNMFSSNDNQFAAQIRRKNKPVYDAFQSYEYAVDNCVSLLTDALRKLIVNGKGSKVNIAKWMMYFAFDVNGEMTFSKRFGHLEKGEDVGGVGQALEDRNDYICAVGIYPSLHPFFWQLIKLLSAILKQVDYAIVFTGQCLEERARARAEGKSPAAPQDMIGRFMDVRDADPTGFTDKEVFVGGLTAIVAGGDTTYTSLGGVLHHLHSNPAALAKLHAEIDEMTRKGEISDPVTWDETKKMPYHNAVLREGLRMHGAVGLPLWRAVPKGGATICGKYFAEGIDVGVNAWVSQYGPAFAPDPDVFRPERWLDSENDKINEMNRAFIVFGAGPRVCQGQAIATLEMTKVLTQLIKHFDFDFTEKWQVYNNFITYPKNLLANIREREVQKA